MTVYISTTPCTSNGVAAENWCSWLCNSFQICSEFKKKKKLLSNLQRGCFESIMNCLLKGKESQRNSCVCDHQSIINGIWQVEASGKTIHTRQWTSTDSHRFMLIKLYGEVYIHVALNTYEKRSFCSTAENSSPQAVVMRVRRDSSGADVHTGASIQHCLQQPGFSSTAQTALLYWVNCLQHDVFIPYRVLSGAWAHA